MIYDRLKQWILSEDRVPANSAFTAGLERDCARLLEEREQHWQEEISTRILPRPKSELVIMQQAEEIESLKKEIEKYRGQVEASEGLRVLEKLELLREIKEIKWNCIMLDDYVENKIKELEGE